MQYLPQTGLTRFRWDTFVCELRVGGRLSGVTVECGIACSTRAQHPRRPLGFLVFCVFLLGEGLVYCLGSACDVVLCAALHYCTMFSMW